MKRRDWKKRTAAFVMSVVMLIGNISVSVFAETSFTSEQAVAEEAARFVAEQAAAEEEEAQEKTAVAAEEEEAQEETAAEEENEAVEEETEEKDEALEEENEKELFPAFDIEDYAIDGTDITLSVEAPEGAFPEGIRLSATLDETPAQVVETANDSDLYTVNEEDIVTFDVHFYLPEDPDTEIEPQCPISITFGNLNMDADKIAVYHVDDDTEGEEGQVEQVAEAEADADTVTVEDLDRFSRIALAPMKLLAVGPNGEYGIKSATVETSNGTFDILNNGGAGSEGTFSKWDNPYYTLNVIATFPNGDNYSDKNVKIDLPLGLLWQDSGSNTPALTNMLEGGAQGITAVNHYADTLGNQSLTRSYAVKDTTETLTFNLLIKRNGNIVAQSMNQTEYNNDLKIMVSWKEGEEEVSESVYLDQITLTGRPASTGWATANTLYFGPTTLIGGITPEEAAEHNAADPLDPWTASYMRILPTPANGDPVTGAYLKKWEYDIEVDYTGTHLPPRCEEPGWLQSDIPSTYTITGPQWDVTGRKATYHVVIGPPPTSTLEYSNTDTLGRTETRVRFDFSSDLFEDGDQVKFTVPQLTATFYKDQIATGVAWNRTITVYKPHENVTIQARNQDTFISHVEKLQLIFGNAGFENWTNNAGVGVGNSEEKEFIADFSPSLDKVRISPAYMRVPLQTGRTLDHILLKFADTEKWGSDWVNVPLLDTKTGSNMNEGNIGNFTGAYATITLKDLPTEINGKTLNEDDYISAVKVENIGRILGNHIMGQQYIFVGRPFDTTESGTVVYVDLKLQGVGYDSDPTGKYTTSRRNSAKCVAKTSNISWYHSFGNKTINAGQSAVATGNTNATINGSNISYPVFIFRNTVNGPDGAYGATLDPKKVVIKNSKGINVAPYCDVTEFTDNEGIQCFKFDTNTDAVRENNIDVYWDTEPYHVNEDRSVTTVLNRNVMYVTFDTERYHPGGFFNYKYVYFIWDPDAPNKGIDDIWGITNEEKSGYLVNYFPNNTSDGLTVKPFGEILVETGSKEHAAGGDYTEYDHGNKILLTDGDSLDVQVRIVNIAANDMKEATAYVPIPVKGENWGQLTDNKPFEFTAQLTGPMTSASSPDPFKIYYARITPTDNAEVLSAVTGWSDTWFADANIIKITGTHVPGVHEDEDTAAERMEKNTYTFLMNLDVPDDTDSPTSWDGGLDLWRPYYYENLTTLSTGDEYSMWNYGERIGIQAMMGGLTGNVWFDLNMDGVHDEDEPAYNGTPLPIRVYDAAEFNMTSFRADPAGYISSLPTVDRTVFWGEGLAEEDGAYEINYLSRERKYVIVAENKEAGTYWVTKIGTSDEKNTNGFAPVKDADANDIYTFQTNAAVVRKSETGYSGASYDLGLIPEIREEEVKPEATKKLTFIGAEQLPEDYEISFQLKADGMTGAASDLEVQPMPEGAEDGVLTVTKAASDLTEAETQVEFGAITLSNPGTYRYKVTEVDGELEDLTYDTKEYTLTYTVTMNEEGKLTVENKILLDEEEAQAIVFTNTYAPETISVTANKVWDDADNQDGVRPEEVTVRLFANGIFRAEETLSEGNNWTCTWEGLPKKYDRGIEILYTVTEDAVSGYAAETTLSADKEGNPVFTFINRYTPGETSVTVTKRWDDEDDYDGLRPETVEVQLLADGEVYGEPAVISEADGWTYTWTNLAEKAEGKDIVYTVEETAIDAYNTDHDGKPVITGDAVTGYVITNAHEVEKSKISGKKVWDDDDDAAGLRPVSITVSLYADGEFLATRTITQADDWAFDFGELPVYAKGSKSKTKIVYSIVEDAVDGYETTYETKEGEGTITFTITNTLKSEESKDNNNNTDSNNTDSNNTDSNKSSGSHSDGGTSNRSTVKTGDDSPVMMWILILIAAVAAAVGAWGLRYNSDKHKKSL